MAKIMEMAINMSLLFSGNFSSQVSPAISKLSELNQKTKSLQATAGQVQKFKSMSTSLTGLREKLNAAQTRVRELRTTMQQTANPTAKMRQEFTRANVDAARLSSAVQKQMKNISQLGKVLRDAGVDTAHLAEAEKKLGGSIEQVAAASKKLQAAQARQKAAQDNYSQLRSQFDWGNMKSDVLSSMAAVEVFKKPIQIDMEFEQSMANVRAVSMSSQEDFEKLRTQAIELGSSTQFTASQAAKSQENLARAGFSVEEIVQTMPGLLSMAAAEGMELSQASEILAGGLRGMQLPMSETNRLVDTLAYTSAHSKTNIANLGEAFKNVAATAALIKIKPEQLASYLGAMANMNVEGGEAGNALKSSFMRLSKPPKEAYNFLQEYKIAVRTKGGELRELPDLLSEIYKKTEKLGSAEQLKVFSGIFGKNYGDSMIKLALASINGSQAQLEAELFTQKDGSAETMARMRNDTLQGDVTSLGSAWEGVMIRIGNALDPINRFFVQTLTTGLQSINNFIDNNTTLVSVITQVGYALGTLMVIGKVYKYGKLAYDMFMAWRELRAATAAIEGASAAFGGLGTMFSAITAKLSTLGAVLMAHPIIAIGTLVAAGVTLAIMNWDKLKEWWDSWVIPNVWEPLKGYLSDAVTWLQEKWQGFCDWISSLNPFSDWKAPNIDIEGGKKMIASGGGGVDMTPSYMRGAQAHAEGGILTTPHIGLVAEAGPEAIIPLTDKSRGIPLLERAASILGMSVSNSAQSISSSGSFQVSNTTDDFLKISSNPSNSLLKISSFSSPSSNSFSSFSAPASNSLSDFSSENSYSVKSAGDFIGQRLNYSSAKFDSTAPVHSAGQAPVINITVNGAGQESRSLAEDIAAKVREALREISSLEERVSFA